MKKLLILLFTALLVLFGCSATEASTTSSVEQVKDDEVIFYMGWDPTYNDDSAFADYVREYTGENVHYMMSPSDNALEKMMLDMSTQAQYNLIKTDTSGFNEVIANDLALDIKPYLDEYGENIYAGIPEENWKSVTDPETGAIYGIPSPMTTEKIDGMIFYRKDVLAENNIEVPTTTEEFLDATCTLAANGVSVPYGINWSSAAYEYSLRAAFGVGYWWNVDENGDVVFIGYDDRYYDYLEYMNQMYECGGFGNSYETYTQEEKNENFINGETVFIDANTWDQAMFAEGLATQGIDYYDAIGVLPPLEGPAGKNTMGSGHKNWHISFIPTYMEQYAAQTIQIVNKLLEPEFLHNVYYGTEDMQGETYEVTEDGTYYLLPGVDPATDLPYPGGDYYLIGADASMQQAEKAVKDEMVKEEIESGGTYTEYDWAYTEAQQYIDYAVYDPLGFISGVPSYSENEAAIETLIVDFSDLYITGDKTEDDIQAVKDELDTKYGYQQIQADVNEWYTSN